MTHTLSLILWMATAQTAGQPAATPAAVPVATLAAAPTATPAAAPAAPAATPAIVVVQCPPTDAERELRAQLDDARSQLDGARRKLAEAKDQLAKAREESGRSDHALAAMLVSDHPNLANVERIGLQNASGSGRWRIRNGVAELFVNRHSDETMAAIVLTLRNPPEAPAWEPKEAFIRAPYYCGDPPLPVALRSSPERIRPGQTARIAVAFDLQDLRLDEPYAVLTLLRDGKWEMETELTTADFRVALAGSGDDQ